MEQPVISQCLWAAAYWLSGFLLSAASIRNTFQPIAMGLCLHISFIGWAFLSVFTLGIGYLFLSPYMIAADCAFYNEVKLLNAGESGYAAPSMANAYEPAVHEAEAEPEPEVVDIPTDEQEVVSDEEEEA